MDIPNGHLFQYSARDGSYARVFEGPVLGAATLQFDGALLLLGVHGAVIRWHEGRATPLMRVDAVRGTRFNDAIADGTGRILSGTMPFTGRPSTLYAIERDGTSRVVVDRLGQSNGMALGSDGRTLYHADTRARMVRAWEYDVDIGEIGSSRIVASFTDGDAAPDGMAMDAEGGLWVALWGGGCVVRLDDAGAISARIDVPTRLTSSVAFGGADLGDLYITTAGGDDRAANGSLAGSLFITRPGIVGLPRHCSALAPHAEDLAEIRSFAGRLRT